MGSIWDNIKQFGSDVVSGIGGAISSPYSSGFVGPTQPSITSSLGGTVTKVAGTLYDSAISRIANWINPPPDPAPTPSAPAPVYVFGGSSPIKPTDSTSPSGVASGSLFGLPQGFGIMLLTIGVGYIVLKRGKL
mgnify:CR=1 FL=1|jgi:hypothetical protein